MRAVEQDADAIGESTSGALPERVQEGLGELAGAGRMSGSSWNFGDDLPVDG